MSLTSISKKIGGVSDPTPFQTLYRRKISCGDGPREEHLCLGKGRMPPCEGMCRAHACTRRLMRKSENISAFCWHQSNCALRCEYMYSMRFYQHLPYILDANTTKPSCAYSQKVGQYSAIRTFKCEADLTRCQGVTCTGLHSLHSTAFSTLW